MDSEVHVGLRLPVDRAVKLTLSLAVSDSGQLGVLQVLKTVTGSLLATTAGEKHRDRP